MKPIIGIFAKIIDADKKSELLYDYAKVIEKSGGLPVLLPYVEEEETLDQFINICDGFMFSGGGDVAPSYYGEETKPTCGAIENYRDKLEFQAIDKIIKMDKPILAICRGMQLINVYLGGTLYQDIPTEIPSQLNHKQKSSERYLVTHDILINEGTPLREITKQSRIIGNSFHHQCVKKLADGLVVTATADDGIIEGYYLPTHKYLMAYQWHPERLYELDKINEKIIRSFVDACK